MAGFGSDAYLMPPLSLLDAATKDTDEARQMRYRQFLDFYQGAQWLEARRPGERRLTINYARAFAHKNAAYLMGKPLKVELEANGEGKGAQELAAKTEQSLAAMWDDNNLASLDYDAALDAAILGDCAFKVTLQPIGHSRQNAKLSVQSAKRGTLPKEGRVCVRSVDVAGLRVGWAGDDLRSISWVREEYVLSAGEVRERYGQGAVALYIVDSKPIRVCELWSEDSFSLELDGKAFTNAGNPYGFVPYVIVPNLTQPRRFWGLSDLEDIMSLNSEFNVRVSILSQLLQMSGNPVLVLENVEDASNMRVGPGAIWALPEGSKASLLEMLSQGGVGLHIEYINLLYQMLHDLSELPGAGFGRGDVSAANSSGVALEIMLNPVVQRVNRKRRIWDEALDLRNRMMLALAGLPVHRSRIIWPDILPRDRAAIVTQEVGLVASSIHSFDTARRNLGDEQPDRENEQILLERTVLGLNAPPGGGVGQSGKVQPPVKLSGALVEGLSGSGG